MGSRYRHIYVQGIWGSNYTQLAIQATNLQRALVESRRLCFQQFLYSLYFCLYFTDAWGCVVTGTAAGVYWLFACDHYPTATATTDDDRTVSGAETKSQRWPFSSCRSGRFEIQVLRQKRLIEKIEKLIFSGIPLSTCGLMAIRQRLTNGQTGRYIALLWLGTVWYAVYTWAHFGTA